MSGAALNCESCGQPHAVADCPTLAAMMAKVCPPPSGSLVVEDRYNHGRWESIGDLMVDLMRDITPRPFWIEFGRYATRITDENKDALSHGLHLALEFQMARDSSAAMTDSQPT